MATPVNKPFRMKAVSPGRLFAYKALERIGEEGAYSSLLLTSAGFKALPLRERAFAHELILGVLRHQSLLDWVMDQCLDLKAKKLEPSVRRLIRSGTYQLLLMDRVPAFAAVSQTVSLCRQIIGRKPQGLVNAVLRRVSTGAQNWRMQMNQPPSDVADHLAIRFSHPEWLVERWLGRFGSQKTITLLQTNNRPPRQDLRLFRSDPSIASYLKTLMDSGHLLPFDFPDGALTLTIRNGSLQENPDYLQLKPYFHIQSRASQCIPYLLPVESGTWLLDACAAPGGKTLILSQRIGAEGKVLALDLYHQRLLPLHRSLQGQPFSNIHIICADSTAALPFSKNCLFSSVLLDAPCTGLGTLRRHPEIRWRVKQDDPLRLQQVQLQLLNSISGIVAPGGCILYSTCSTEPEENEDVIFRFLQNNPHFVCRRPSFPYLADDWLDGNGFFRTFPSHPEEDGFFAALLNRDASPMTNA